jgi:hypothetical protein
MKRVWLPLLAGLWLAGCFPLYPGPSGDYDVAFASDYWKDATLEGPRTRASGLTLEQLYAAHRYGLNKMHPARGLGAEYARRGAAAASDLRARLEQQQSFSQVASILEAFAAMQEGGSYDVRSDPALVALIQRSAAAYPKDPYATLRDMADELETGTRIPTWFQPYWRGPLEGRGKDYDDDFAEDWCRRCDYREFIAGLDALTLDQLWSIQRYEAETRLLGRNVDHFMARRGAAAVPFLKAKLAEPTSDVMVWNAMSTLELMRDLGTYDVRGDAELMGLAEAAVLRADPNPGPLQVQLERLRAGTRMRDVGERLPAMGG